MAWIIMPALPGRLARLKPDGRDSRVRWKCRSAAGSDGRSLLFLRERQILPRGQWKLYAGRGIPLIARACRAYFLRTSKCPIGCVTCVRGPHRIAMSFWPRDEWFLPLYQGGEEKSDVSWPSLRGLRCAYALSDQQRVLLLAPLPAGAVLHALLPACMRRMQYILFPAAVGSGAELSSVWLSFLECGDSTTALQKARRVHAGPRALPDQFLGH
jgi:hypothetical protein